MLLARRVVVFVAQQVSRIGCATVGTVRTEQRSWGIEVRCGPPGDGFPRWVAPQTPYRGHMASDDGTELTLRVRAESDEERAALEQALLRARASELAEVRRNQVRVSAGYGDATTRDAMTGEAGRAQVRWTMLDRLLAALRDPSEAGVQ